MSTLADELEQACEIFPNRLYFATVSKLPEDTDNEIYFTVDNEFIYENFCADFGPFNLATSYRFCRKLKKMLKKHQSKRIYFCTGLDLRIRSNTAVLIGMFAICYLNKTAEQAWQCLSEATPEFLPFRDASYTRVTYKLTVRDVLKGIYQALLNGFFNFETFDLEEYEHYERIEHGDFNWIIPGKFISLAGPHNVRHVDRGYPHLAPEDYFDYFQEHGVTDIVRLNKKMYDREKFIEAGFKHHDLFFIDGSCPPQAILEEFLTICEEASGTVVVHCKAGLGRTGTLIGCYIMKHYRMTPAETIAWMRIARPGSIIGPQQLYMRQQQMDMWDCNTEDMRKHEEDRPQWALHDLSEFGLQELMPLTPTRGLPLKPYEKEQDSEVDIDEEALAAPADCHEHEGYTQGDELTSRKALAQQQHHHHPADAARLSTPTNRNIFG